MKLAPPGTRPGRLILHLDEVAAVTKRSRSKGPALGLDEGAGGRGFGCGVSSLRTRPAGKSRAVGRSNDSRLCHGHCPSLGLRGTTGTHGLPAVSHATQGIPGAVCGAGPRKSDGATGRMKCRPSPSREEERGSRGRSSRSSPASRVGAGRAISCQHSHGSAESDVFPIHTCPIQIVRVCTVCGAHGERQHEPDENDIELAPELRLRLVNPLVLGMWMTGTGAMVALPPLRLNRTPRVYTLDICPQRPSRITECRSKCSQR
jgi:hypothetical protein